MPENVELYKIDIDIDLAVKDSQRLKEEIELLKAQTKLAKDEQGELSEEYIKYSAALKTAQKDLRVNTKLTEDAIQADLAKEGSIEQLRKELSVVSVQWAKLSKEERENEEVGGKLAAQKLALTNELKAEEKATGDARRNVGNYAESILDAVSSLQKEQAELQKNKKALLDYSENTKLSESEQEKLNKELIITNKRLDETKEELSAYGETSEDVVQGTGSLSDGFGELDDATGGTIGQVKALTKQFLVLLSNPIVAIVAGIAVAITAVAKAFGQSQEGADTFNKALDAVSASVDAITGRLAKIGSIAKAVFTGKKSLKEGVEESKEAFKGLKEEIEETVEKSNEIFEIKKNLEELTIAGTVAIANLNKVAEKQGAIADDATKSFQEREKAAQKAEKAEIKARQTELKLAQEQLKVIKAENKLKDEQGLLTRELRQEEADLIAATIEAETALEVTRIEQSKRRAELAQDNFEQELDILLDIADNTKTVNERRIADEELTFETRKKILEDTQKLLNQSFDQQIALFEQENQIQINRTALLTLNNEQAFEYLRGLGLSEIATNRLREVIIERKTAEQDLLEAERDINEEAKMLQDERNAWEVEAYELGVDRLNQLQVDELNYLTNKQQAEQDNVFAVLEIQKQKLAIQKEQEIANAEAIGADTKAIKDKYAAIDKELEQAKFNETLSIAGDFASNIAVIFGEQTKVGKAAAIAATVIQTAQSAVSAMNSLAGIPVIGVGLGIAAAAAAIVAGTKQIQAIRNTNVDGVADGIAPSNTPTASGGVAPAPPTNPAFEDRYQGKDSEDVDAQGSDIGNGIVARYANDSNYNQLYNNTVLVLEDVEQKQFTANENNAAAVL